MPSWGAGEYPLASSSASERAESNKALRFRRGEMVVCTFTMQVSPWQAPLHSAACCMPGGPIPSSDPARTACCHTAILS